MGQHNRWGQLMRIRLHRVPVISSLAIELQEGIWVGGALGIAVGLVLGAVLGFINRGLAGVAVGGLSGAIAGFFLGSLCGAMRATWRMTSQPRVDLAIRLDEAGARYAPGETFSGGVEIRTTGNLQIQEGILYLVCRGTYASDRTDHKEGGDQEQTVRKDPYQYVAETLQVVPEGRIVKGASHRYPFDLAIPTNALPTHHGWICAIRWSLHMQLVTASGEPVLAEREIYVEAEPPGLHAAHRVYATRIEAPQGHIVLTLAHAVCVEGEEIEAQVRLSPLEAIYADEIRVVLLRIENTPDGNGCTTYVTGVDLEQGAIEAQVQAGGRGTTYVWLEDQVIVESERQLSAADTLNYVARLKVPVCWRPTFITAQGAVHWKVGAIVSAQGYDDLRAFHEVIVHTGVPELRGILASRE